MLPKIVNRMPTPNAVTIAVVQVVFAFWKSSAPSARLVIEPLPMPIVKAQACIKNMRVKVTPTAPLAEVPSFDTKKVSAVL